MATSRGHERERTSVSTYICRTKPKTDPAGFSDLRVEERIAADIVVGMLEFAKVCEGSVCTRHLREWGKAG